MIGTTSTPISLALVEVAGELKLPLIALGASAKITDTVDEKRKWVFKVSQTDALMADAIVNHIAKNKMKSAAFIGFNDAYGDGWASEFNRAFGIHQLNMVASEILTR